MKNERLEKLSDRVRRGEPVSLTEALDVIEYQERLNAEHKQRTGWFGWLVEWIKR